MSTRVIRALLLLGVEMLNIVFTSSELPAYISKGGKAVRKMACLSNQEGSGKDIEDSSRVHMAAKPGAVFTLSPKVWGGACGKRDALCLHHDGRWASLLPGSTVSPPPCLPPVWRWLVCGSGSVTFLEPLPFFFFLCPNVQEEFPLPSSRMERKGRQRCSLLSAAENPLPTKDGFSCRPQVTVSFSVSVGFLALPSLTLAKRSLL